MKIVKHFANHDKYWITIQTRIVYDKRLSPLALKLLLHLLICNENEYFPTIHRIAKQFKISETETDRKIAELKSAGYLESYGKRQKTVWHIYECPKYIDTTGGATCDTKTDTTGGVPLLNNNVGGVNAQQHEEEKTDTTGGAYKDFDEYANVELPF